MQAALHATPSAGREGWLCCITGLSGLALHIGAMLRIAEHCVQHARAQCTPSSAATSRSSYHSSITSKRKYTVPSRRRQCRRGKRCPSLVLRNLWYPSLTPVVFAALLFTVRRSTSTHLSATVIIGHCSSKHSLLQLCTGCSKAEECKACADLIHASYDCATSCA